MLKPGSDVGGRYRVENSIQTFAGGGLHKAKDLRNEKPIALWHFTQEALETSGSLDRLRESVRAATGLTHRNITTTFGLGKGADGSVFVAREMLDGHTLTELARAKSQEAKSFSPRGALNLLSHVANGLSFVQPKLAHGMLTGDSVTIGASGQIKVADFGMAPTLRHIEELMESVGKYIAPEVVAGEEPTPKSDVYSLGAMLYLMVCGVAPQAGGSPAASMMQAALPGEIDEFIARCMSENPADRPKDAREMRSQLLAIVEAAGAAPTGDENPFDDELTLPEGGPTTTIPAPEIDIDIATDDDLPVDEAPPEDVAPPPEEAPPAQPAGKTANAPPPPAAPPAPESMGDMFDSALDPSDNGRSQSGPPLPPPAGGDQLIDLGSLLTESTQTENQVWMVQKNNLDHGPFSTRELGQQIFGGQVSGDDQVLNMDTGVRKRCVLWPEFEQIVDKAMERRKREEEAEALRKVETVEKGVGYARYVVAAGIVVFIGLVIGSYFIYRSATRVTEPTTGDELADLVAAGEMTINTGGGVLPMEETKRRRRRGGRRGGGGGGRGGLTAEEAMAAGADYGNLNGEIRQLTVGQINSVMNRRARSFYPCLAGYNGRVSLDFVINGDGSVAGVSVSPSSLGGCMSGRMRSVRFPAFNAPRMRASFYFEVAR